MPSLLRRKELRWPGGSLSLGKPHHPLPATPPRILHPGMQEKAPLGVRRQASLVPEPTRGRWLTTAPTLAATAESTRAEI